MSDYTKGMLSLPAFILAIGAVALIVVTLVYLVAVVFSSVGWEPPKKMLDDKGNFRLRYTTPRVSMAAMALTADKAWRFFWFGGFGLYLTRLNRGGFHEMSDMHTLQYFKLADKVSEDYREWLEQFTEQGELEDDRT